MRSLSLHYTFLWMDVGVCESNVLKALPAVQKSAHRTLLWPSGRLPLLAADQRDPGSLLRCHTLDPTSV